MRLTMTIAVTLAATLAAGLSPLSPAEASMEVQMAENSVPAFASQKDAEAFLAEALPAATAANPKYHTPGTDYDRRWLIKTITFARAEGGGSIVAMDETFEDYRSGALVSRGTHQAKFALARRRDFPRNSRRCDRKRGKGAGSFVSVRRRPLRASRLGRTAVG